MFTQIKQCRVCGNEKLASVIDLGEQYLTGVFLHKVSPEKITKGPLRLVKCVQDESSCGLLQLEHSYSLDEMYGENYGYRSGLNASMVRHLEAKIAKIREMITLKAGDLVIDIGSNDGTSLNVYPAELTLVGVDPSGKKFQQYYQPHVHLIPDFFSGHLITKAFPGKKAKVVTSFSMFYDLESPVAFARQVAEVLDTDGIWVFEQSYMPLMLERNSYDTICHEHLEYYGLQQIAWIARAAGLKIIDVEFNDVNGGSFSVVTAPLASKRESSPIVAQTIARENELGLTTLTPYLAFAERSVASRAELREFMKQAQREGKTVCGLGASTKGNVVLQYCGFTQEDIPLVAEVNPDKFGAFTPGSWIPIEEEKKVLASKPDYLIVLPWHFRSFFMESAHLKGHKLVFPLPRLEVVERL